MDAKWTPKRRVGKQTGQKVEFGMKIAGGTFQGNLNKEGTELAGQLIHEANSTPLTLRKK